MEYLFTPALSAIVLPYLNDFIEQFLNSFVALFPGKMTPKLHYMVHYDD